MAEARRSRIASRCGLALCLLTGVACTVHFDVAGVDRLVGEIGSVAVVRAEGYTLWSPFPPEGTELWRAALDQELPAQSRAFGVDLGSRRVQVVLDALEGLAPRFEQEADGQVRVSWPDGPDPTRGLHGFSFDDEVHVFVPATAWMTKSDGTRIPSITSPLGDRGVTLRHEVAHWIARSEGLEVADWLDEGLAHFVSGLSLENGRLLDRGATRRERDRARRFGARDLPLADLLDWVEDLTPLLEAVRERDMERDVGIEAAPRVSCGLYVRFLLECDGGGEPVEDLAERLRALGRMSRAEHLAGEARWQAWLDEQLSDGAPAASPR